MNKRFQLMTVALLAFPLAAEAQTSVTATGSASVSHSTSAPSQRVGGEAALAATAESRLPEAPVRRVIAEGRARGASASEIDRAALSVHARLQASADALSRRSESGSASHAEVMAGAEALASGARPEDLERLRDSAPEGRSLTASLRVLADLTATGVAPARATADLAARLGAGATDSAIAKFGATAAAAIHGAAPAVSATGSGALGVGEAAGGISAGVVGGVGASLIP